MNSTTSISLVLLVMVLGLPVRPSVSQTASIQIVHASGDSQLYGVSVSSGDSVLAAQLNRFEAWVHTVADSATTSLVFMSPGTLDTLLHHQFPPLDSTSTMAALIGLVNPDSTINPQGRDVSLALAINENIPKESPHADSVLVNVLHAAPTDSAIGIVLDHGIQELTSGVRYGEYSEYESVQKGVETSALFVMLDKTDGWYPCYYIVWDDILAAGTVFTIVILDSEDDNWNLLNAVFPTGEVIPLYPAIVESIETPSLFSSSSSTVFPNPVVGNASLVVDLDHPADVTFEVVDMLGRVVQRVSNRALPAGAHQIDLRVRDFAVGFYGIRMLMRGQNGQQLSTTTFAKGR